MRAGVNRMDVNFPIQKDCVVMKDVARIFLMMSPAGDCVTIAYCHCETPLRCCDNLIFSRAYEIASLIAFAMTL